jgi:hypothetical protein
MMMFAVSTVAGDISGNTHSTSEANTDRVAALENGCDETRKITPIQTNGSDQSHLVIDHESIDLSAAVQAPDESGVRLTSLRHGL